MTLKVVAILVAIPMELAIAASSSCFDSIDSRTSGAFDVDGLSTGTSICSLHLH